MQRVYRLSSLATTKDQNGNIKEGKIPVSPATVWRWVSQGHFPAPFKLGKNTTVWDADAVDKWLEAQRGAQQ